VKIFVLLAMAWLVVARVSLAESQDEPLPPPLPTPSVTKQKLIVGLAVDPPFVIHETDGSWTAV
jgi:hypothetical protein